MIQPALCEINKCEVLAVGRCDTCNLAFCATHQGYAGISGSLDFKGEYKGQRYPNLCSVCTLASEKELEKEREIKSQYEPELRRRIQFIARKLSEANVSGQLPRRKIKGLVGSFSSKLEFQNTLEDLEPAWPVGKYPWGTGKITSGDNTFHDGHELCELGVTNEGKIVAMGDEKQKYEIRFPHIKETDYNTYLLNNDSCFFNEQKGQYYCPITTSLERIRIQLEEIAECNNVKV